MPLLGDALPLHRGGADFSCSVSSRVIDALGDAAGEACMLPPPSLPARPSTLWQPGRNDRRRPRLAGREKGSAGATGAPRSDDAARERSRLSGGGARAAATAVPLKLNNASLMSSELEESESNGSSRVACAATLM